MIHEWRLDILRVGGNSQVTAALYGLQPDGQWSLVADEYFGPFDTASDLVRWLTRSLVGQHVFHLA